MRVSLTADPVEEVVTAKRYSARPAGLRTDGVGPDRLPHLRADEVSTHAAHRPGGGTAAERAVTSPSPWPSWAVWSTDRARPRAADVGIAGGKGEGLLFAKGKVLRKVPENQLVDALFEEIDKL